MKSSGRQGRKKTESDHRCRLETARGKVGIGRIDHLVQLRDTLVKLRADAANQPIAKRRHLPEQNRWTRLEESIGLRQRGQSNVALHQRGRLMSSSEYSG